MKRRNDLVGFYCLDSGGRPLGRREEPKRWTRKAFGCNRPCCGQWGSQASLELEASHGRCLLSPISSVLNITYYDHLLHKFVGLPSKMIHDTWMVLIGWWIYGWLATLILYHLLGLRSLWRTIVCHISYFVLNYKLWWLFCLHKFLFLFHVI